MKIIGCNKDLSNYSLNFVDVKNVFVGFNTEQSCCEDVGYFFSDVSGEKLELSDEVLDEYVFDVSYSKVEFDNQKYDEGGCVKFKLFNPENKILYLTLYNSHNGYYSHGFVFSNGNSVISDG